MRLLVFRIIKDMRLRVFRISMYVLLAVFIMPAQAEGDQEPEEIVVTLATEFELEPQSDGSLRLLPTNPRLGNSAQECWRDLPSGTFIIALPANATVADVSVIEETTELHPNMDISEIPPIRQAILTPVEPDETEAYRFETDAEVDARCVADRQAASLVVQGEQTIDSYAVTDLGGARLLNVRWNAAAYVPDGSLVLRTDVTIRVSLQYDEPSPGVTEIAGRIWEQLNASVENVDLLITNYQLRSTQDHLVIVVKDSSVVPHINDFVAFKQTQGYMVTTVFSDTIKAGAPTVFPPVAAWNHICPLQPDYVLLAVSAKDLNPIKIYLEKTPKERTTFSDDFFAYCATGTDAATYWNADGDLFWGELKDDKMLYRAPNVAVGRIPTSDGPKIEQILGHSMRFERRLTPERFTPVVTAEFISDPPSYIHTYLEVEDMISYGFNGVSRSFTTDVARYYEEKTGGPTFAHAHFPYNNGADVGEMLDTWRFRIPEFVLLTGHSSPYQLGKANNSPAADQPALVASWGCTTLKMTLGKTATTGGVTSRFPWHSKDPPRAYIPESKLIALRMMLDGSAAGVIGAWWNQGAGYTPMTSATDIVAGPAGSIVKQVTTVLHNRNVPVAENLRRAKTEHLRRFVSSTKAGPASYLDNTKYGYYGDPTMRFAPRPMLPLSRPIEPASNTETVPLKITFTAGSAWGGSNQVYFNALRKRQPIKSIRVTNPSTATLTVFRPVFYGLDENGYRLGSVNSAADTDALIAAYNDNPTQIFVGDVPAGLSRYGAFFVRAQRGGSTTSALTLDTSLVVEYEPDVRPIDIDAQALMSAPNVDGLVQDYSVDVPSGLSEVRFRLRGADIPDEKPRHWNFTATGAAMHTLTAFRDLWGQPATATVDVGIGTGELQYTLIDGGSSWSQAGLLATSPYHFTHSFLWLSTTRIVLNWSGPGPLSRAVNLKLSWPERTRDDVAMYVKRGSLAAPTSFDYSSATVGTSDEEVLIIAPTAGRYYVYLASSILPGAGTSRVQLSVSAKR